MKVLVYAQQKNSVPAGPPLFICHEASPEEVQDANANGTAEIEVAWPVSGPVEGSHGIRGYDLPGGQMAHVIHWGPYASCESTYRSLFTWISENGLTISGPIRESYPNDPREVAPEDIITEIFVPVRGCTHSGTIQGTHAVRSQRITAVWMNKKSGTNRNLVFCVLCRSRRMAV